MNDLLEIVKDFNAFANTMKDGRAYSRLEAKLHKFNPVTFHVSPWFIENNLRIRRKAFLYEGNFVVCIVSSLLPKGKSENIPWCEVYQVADKETAKEIMESLMDLKWAEQNKIL